MGMKRSLIHTTSIIRIREAAIFSSARERKKRGGEALRALFMNPALH
jgi:hypothetical protein